MKTIAMHVQQMIAVPIPIPATVLVGSGLVEDTLDEAELCCV